MAAADAIRARRPFGAPEDLAVDLCGDPARAAVGVVAACVLPPGAGEAPEERSLALTLAGRIGALADVVRATTGEEALEVDLTCAAPGCGAALEAPVPLARLREMGARAEAEPVVAVGLDDGRRVRLRRPTGADLESWRAGPLAPGEAALGVARSLLVDPVDDATLDEVHALLDAAMAELDPLPAFRVVASCPACGAEATAEVELEATLLFRLARDQRRLLRQVHRLASAYGWSEREVLEVAPWRREAYLALLAGEAEA